MNETQPAQKQDIDRVVAKLDEILKVLQRLSPPRTFTDARSFPSLVSHESK